MEFLRLFVAETIYHGTKFSALVASLIAPSGLKYHIQPSILPDVEGIEIGIAFRAQPCNPNDEKPSMVSLNIGHMAHITQGPHAQDSVLEQQQIRLSNVTMLQSLANDPDAAENGFGGAVQAEFFHNGNIIEYNLSAWRDGDAARHWAQTNAVHKNVTNKFHKKGANMLLFMLSSLFCAFRT